MLRPIAAAFLLLACAGPAGARDPGTVFYRCSATHNFSLPGAFGGPLRTSDGLDGQIRNLREEPESPESISASIDVEEQGEMNGLSMAWLQNGFAAPPLGSRWRSDLHVFMAARFPVDPYWIRSRLERFDPADLEIELRVNTRARVGRPLFVRLLRTNEPATYFTLGGMAVPPWRDHVTVKLLWRDLVAYAGGEDRLWVQLARRPEEFISWRAGGTIDLAIMPAVMEHFAAAEAEVRALAPHARERCHRMVEPEPPEEATF